MTYYLNPFINILKRKGSYKIYTKDGDIIHLTAKEYQVLISKSGFNSNCFAEHRLNLLIKKGIVLDKEIKNECIENEYFVNKGWFQNSGLGVDSYEEIRNKTILILGCGGLGTHVSWNLCALGIRNIILVDSDVVEQDNFNRQILYTNEDIGKDKVSTLKNRLLETYQNINIKTYRLNIENPEDILGLINDNGVDLTVKALDTPLNHLTLFGDFFVENKVPYVSGATANTSYVLGPTYHPDMENKFLSRDIYNMNRLFENEELVSGKGTSLPFIMAKISENVTTEIFYILIGRLDLIRFNDDIYVKDVLEKRIERNNYSWLNFILLPLLLTISLNTYLSNFVFLIYIITYFSFKKISFKIMFLTISISVFILNITNYMYLFRTLPSKTLLETLEMFRSILFMLLTSTCFYTIISLLIIFIISIFIKKEELL